MIIESNTTQQKIIGYLPTTTTNGGSYRSELTGIYAALTHLLATTEVHNIKEGIVNVHCDNEKAILLSSITGSRLPLKTSHADIVHLIRATVIKLPTTTKFQHIYGHQDKWLPYTSLPRPAQLNVICDKLAKTGLKRDISLNNTIQDI